MAATFIRETQTTWVGYAVSREAHRIIEGSTTNQSHVAHLVQFVFKPERSGRGDLLSVIRRGQIHFECLVPYQRMIEEIVTAKLEPVAWPDCHAFAIGFNAHRLQDPHIPAQTVRPFSYGLVEQIYKRQ